MSFVVEPFVFEPWTVEVPVVPVLDLSGIKSFEERYQEYMAEHYPPKDWSEHYPPKA